MITNVLPPFLWFTVYRHGMTKDVVSVNESFISSAHQLCRRGLAFLQHVCTLYCYHTIETVITLVAIERAQLCIAIYAAVINRLKFFYINW